MDLSLDDIIQQRRIKPSMGRGRGRDSLRGVRRGGISRRNPGELFGEFGTIRKASVHYDKSGRSLGTAEVVYASSLSAIKAKNHYNGVPLDGRAMDIQIVGSGLESNGSQKPFSNRGRAPGAGRRVSGMRGRGSTFGGARGRDRGRRRNQKPTVTKEELDNQLAAYNAQRG